MVRGLFVDIRGASAANQYIYILFSYTFRHIAMQRAE